MATLLYTDKFSLRYGKNIEKIVSEFIIMLVGEIQHWDEFPSTKKLFIFTLEKNFIDIFLETV